MKKKPKVKYKVVKLRYFNDRLTPATIYLTNFKNLLGVIKPASFIDLELSIHSDGELFIKVWEDSTVLISSCEWTSS